MCVRTGVKDATIKKSDKTQGVMPNPGSVEEWKGKQSVFLVTQAQEASAMRVCVCVRACVHACVCARGCVCVCVCVCV